MDLCLHLGHGRDTKWDETPSGGAEDWWVGTSSLYNPHIVAYREVDHTLEYKTNHNIWNEEAGDYSSIACIDFTDIGCWK